MVVPGGKWLGGGMKLTGFGRSRSLGGKGEGVLAFARSIVSVGGLSNESQISSETWEWLFRHAGFPGHRLPVAAERLVLFAAAAQGGGATGTGNELTIRQDGAMLASQRQQALNRSHTHIKSNNRTKI